MRSSVCSHYEWNGDPFQLMELQKLYQSFAGPGKGRGGSYMYAFIARYENCLQNGKYFCDSPNFQSRIYIFFLCPHRRTGSVGVYNLVHFQLHAPQSAINFGELCIDMLARTAYHRHAWGNESIENVRVNSCNNYIQCCICVNHVSLLQ